MDCFETDRISYFGSSDADVLPNWLGSPQKYIKTQKKEPFLLNFGKDLMINWDILSGVM